MSSKSSKDGPQIYYHKNGKIRKELNYKDGLIDGFYITYFDNGQLESKVTFKDGNKHGLCNIYYSNGQLESEMMYENSSPVGPYTIFYDNGDIKEQGIFSHDGRMIELSIREGLTVDETLIIEDESMCQSLLDTDESSFELDN